MSNETGKPPALLNERNNFYHINFLQQLQPMARTFTLQFQHNNREYTAVVSQVQGSVCVYLPDQSLHHLLPNGRFSYNAEQGLNVDPHGQSPVQNLLLDVLAAIEQQTHRTARL